MLDNAYIIIILILVINIVYVSFSTIRMILTLKGRRYLAAAASTIEVVVYVLGLSLILDNLDDIQNIIAYAIGFALGVIIGSIIEERLAIGYVTVNVVSSDPALKFTETLRDAGFGVTTWRSSGLDGDRLSIQVLTSRKRELSLYRLITEIDPRAFIVTYEPKQIKGGFWVKQVRAGKKKKQTQQKEKVQNTENVVVTEEKAVENVVKTDFEENNAQNSDSKPKT